MEAPKANDETKPKPKPEPKTKGKKKEKPEPYFRIEHGQFVVTFK